MTKTQIHPIFLKSKKILENLVRSYPHVVVVETIRDQLIELYKIRHPESIFEPVLNDESLNNFIKEITKGDSAQYGSWVYYPWNQHVVHILPREEHTELRTARNRDLITLEEQRAFYHAHIAVAGLSVGNSVVTTIVQTGGGSSLSLADHDILSGSNTNRIRSGFSDLGLSKVMLISRYVYGIDPYTKIYEYPEGLSDRSIHRFLTYPRKVKVVADEMDNLYLKIRLRIEARKLRIPVVMATDNGDNALIDVERYDINPALPLFNGVLPEKELVSVPDNISRSDAARLIVRLVGEKNVAPRMKSSLAQLGKTLYTWPQLGNSAFLAGCLATLAIRKIITGSSIHSGSYPVNIDTSLQ